MPIQQIAKELSHGVVSSVLKKYRGVELSRYGIGTMVDASSFWWRWPNTSILYLYGTNEAREKKPLRV
jgi:hypothetical protein